MGEREKRKCEKERTRERKGKRKKDKKKKERAKETERSRKHREKGAKGTANKNERLRNGNIYSATEVLESGTRPRMPYDDKRRYMESKHLLEHVGAGSVELLFSFSSHLSIQKVREID